MTRQAAPPSAARGRPWLAAAGAALIVAGLAVEGLARRYVVAGSAQFVVFAMVAPALIVLGAPWRLLHLSGPLDRLAAARRRQTSFLRAGAFLLAFIAVTVAWRVPPVMDALAGHPLLVLPELITLLAAGTGLWLELVSSPPLSPRLPQPAPRGRRSPGHVVCLGGRLRARAVQPPGIPRLRSGGRRPERGR